MRFPLAFGTGLGVAGALASLALAAACGSRTGLDVDGLAPDQDATSDTFSRPDARDGPFEALPKIDARPLPDVVRNDCPDAATTFIYVITTQYDLYSFNPATGGFSRIGAIACPAQNGATPFSMAVDRKGAAYVLFNNGELFRVSTATAACIATTFATREPDFANFGMGFASDTNGPAETLFVASDDLQGTGRLSRLAKIDVKTFKLTVIGDMDPRVNNAELTGTGDGRLFGFYSTTKDPSRLDTAPTAIGQFDKVSAILVAETVLPTVHLGSHWAFGFWGGDFYTFSGPSGGTDVTRVRPSDGSVSVVAHLGEEIVGAGVSTCAPEQ